MHCKQKSCSERVQQKRTENMGHKKQRLCPQSSQAIRDWRVCTKGAPGRHDTRWSPFNEVCASEHRAGYHIPCRDRLRLRGLVGCAGEGKREAERRRKMVQGGWSRGQWFMLRAPHSPPSSWWLTMTKCTLAPTFGLWFVMLYSAIVGTKKWSPGDRKRRFFPMLTSRDLGWQSMT